MKVNTGKLWLTLAVTFAFLTTACSTNSTIPSQITLSSKQDSCVVLVHGLWRSGFAMNSIASHLNAKGYSTVSVDYPSTQYTIPVLSENYLSQSVEECRSNNASHIHIVSHSMGGILTRQYLQTHSLPENSVVVMLSPPNQGSELSEIFGESWWYSSFVGPAGVSLTKTDKGIINKLAPVKERIGIIAAYRDWSLWPSSWLPAPNDGTVSVESMRLDEMDDFLEIESGHAMMRYNQEVQDQIVYFLENGVFFRAEENKEGEG